MQNGVSYLCVKGNKQLSRYSGKILYSLLVAGFATRQLITGEMSLEMQL